MKTYYVETVMENGTKERVLLNAETSGKAMQEAHGGHKEDGKVPHYSPIKRSVTKSQALKLIEEGVRNWTSL